MVLVDCGATHNFILSNLVSMLKIPITETPKYGVIIGLKNKVKSQGICKSVVVKLQQLTITGDFLPLKLGRIDLIFGLKWLAMLGETKNDWKRLTMAFEMEGCIVVLKGDLSFYKAMISLKSMVKELQ